MQRLVAIVIHALVTCARTRGIRTRAPQFESFSQYFLQILVDGTRVARAAWDIVIKEYLAVQAPWPPVRGACPRLEFAGVYL